MVRIDARLIVLGAVLTTLGAVTACSGSSPSPAGSSSAGAAGVSGTGEARTASSGTAKRSTDADARKAMPAVTPTAVTGVSYAPPSVAARARFAPVLKASGGVLSSSSVKTLKVSGGDVGGVAVYGTKPGLAKSQTFQDQYVVQLINAVAGQHSSPRFVRANGQVMALSTGPSAVAGWFEGDHVVLVYRAGPTPDLAALALGVRNAPSGR
jgi:hypothetical protein